MGRVILCETTPATTSYIFPNTKIEVFSYEELCYYIYNNIYLIGHEFVNGRLVEFLRQTGEEELADRVRNLMDKKAGLAQIIVTILKTVDYYSVEEIEQIREILGTLGKQNICERLKTRGDGFLNNECYFSAVKCYESVIKEYQCKGLLAVDITRVYHNLGTAYARMFMYSQAADYYDEAYRYGQHEESKKCAIAARILAKRDKAPVNVDVTEDEYVAGCELETLMDNARYSDEYRELEKLEALKENDSLGDYNRAVSAKLYEWKNSYIKYSRIF